jgi:hypothetical protein
MDYTIIGNDVNLASSWAAFSSAQSKGLAFSQCARLFLIRLSRSGRVTARRLPGDFCRAFTEMARHFMTRGGGSCQSIDSLRRAYSMTSSALAIRLGRTLAPPGSCPSILQRVG